MNFSHQPPCAPYLPIVCKEGERRTSTTPATRGSLRIFAYVNAKGKVITDSDCGGWTMKGSKGIVDSSGDVHPIDNDAQTVADIISGEAGETVTAADIKALWAKLI